MWQCKRCGQQIDDAIGLCWDCKLPDPRPPDVVAALRNAGHGETNAVLATADAMADSAVRRYRDAYLIARVTTTIGSTVKILGVGLAVFIVVASGAIGAYVKHYGE